MRMTWDTHEGEDGSWKNLVLILQRNWEIEKQKVG